MGMNLNDFRKKIPQLEGLDDEAALNLLHEVYYPDADKARMATALGVKITKPEPVRPQNTLMGFIGDRGLDLVKGAVAVPEAAVGVADLVTGGAAGRAAEEIGFRPREAKEILSGMQSDAYRDRQAQFQAADGIVAKTGVALTNPSLIAGAVTESLPLMAAGGAVGRGVMAVAPKMASPVVAGALGEGAVAAGSTAEQVRQQTADGYLTPKQAVLSAAAGVGTAVFGYAGAKAAKAMGIADLDTALVRGSMQATRDSQIGVIKRVAGGMFSESMLEELPQSVVEQMAQNIALDKPVMQDVDSAIVMGALSGAATGGSAALLSRPKTPTEDAADTIRTNKVPEAGTLSKAVNTGIEASAKAVEATAPAPSLTNFDPATMIPENPLLAGARVRENDRRQEAMTDQAMAKLERMNANDMAVINSARFDQSRGANEISPTEVVEPAQAGDILNPAGEPFKTRMAADRAAKKTPGAVVPVEGGFIVRPQESVNVQDVLQAPEVSQAAPVVSPPGQATQAVGAQPAGPTAGVPTEGSGAVEATGVSGEFADLFDEQGRPKFSNAQSVKDFKKRTGLGQDGVRAIQVSIQEGRPITVDEARQVDLAGQERRKAGLEQSKADSEADAQAAKQNSANPTEPSKVLGDYEIPGLEGGTNRVRVIQRGGRIEAISLEEGTVSNDLSRLIQSGQTVEQALAALYGDHGPNEAPNPSRVKRAGQPTSAAAPADDTNPTSGTRTEAQAPAAEAPAPAGSDAPGAAAVPAPAGPAQVEGGGVANPTKESRGPAASEAWKNEGKSAADLMAERVDALGKEFAGTLAEAVREDDFDAKEVPTGVKMWAEEQKIPADDLRAAVLRHISGFDIPAKIAKQIRSALNPANPPTQAQAGTPAEGAGESRPAPVAAPEPTAEQKIRQAFDAAPRTIGNWHKLTVEHNGKTQEFLANMKRVNTSGKRDSAIHLVNIRPGRLMAGDPLQDLAYYYKLDGKNNLVEEGIPSIATPEQLKAFGRPDPRLIPVSQRKQADGFENLLSLKSTKLILDDGRGRKLFEVKVTPEFRNRHFVNGRMPMVDGLELKEKSAVTGNAYDDGYILIDNREQLAARRAATAGAQAAPAAGAQAQAQGAAPDLNDVGARWTRMTRLEREAVLKLAGWRTNAGGLNVVGKRLVTTSWGNMVAGTQDRVARTMSARAEFGGNQGAAATAEGPISNPTFAPEIAQQAQSATENVATDAEQSPAQETTHNGTRIYPAKIKVGDEVKSMWAVESPDNQRRRAAGERTIGGDSLHDTIEQAKAAAEREAKRDAEQQAAKAEQDAADKARRDAEEARKAANRPKSVVERRKDAILDGPSKIGQGTKRAVIATAVDNGYAIEAKMVYDHAAKKRDQEAVDRASRAGYILGVSNENLPLVKAGNEAKARLKEGKYEKPEYRVYQGSDTTAPFREITKTEYDYAQELKAQRAAAQQAEAAPAAATQQAADDFLPEGWTKSVNGFTKRPVYRMEQGVGQPFAVVTQTEGMTYEVQIRHGDKQLTTSTQRGALSEVLAAAEAELGRMTQADSVTHADPGEKAEAATPAVVTDSLKKAARNEDTKPSEMRKWLVAEIDKELLQAPDRADYDEAVKRLGEKDAISGYTGNGPLGKNNETGYVTFDVPGDGKYKVRNSVRGLLEFRKNVMASQGFKDSGQKRAKPEQNDGVQGGSGGSMTAIANMIEEGDFEAARDYAEAVGIKLEDVKVPRGDMKPAWEKYLKDGTLPPAAWMPSKEWQFQDIGASSYVPDLEKRSAILTRVADGSTYVATVKGNLEGTSASYTVTKDGKEIGRASSRRPFSDTLRMAEDAMPEANDKPAPSKASDTGWNMAGTGYGGKRYIGRNITLDDGREVVARVYENAGIYEEAEVKVDGVRKFAVTDRENAQDKADAFIKTLTATSEKITDKLASPDKMTPRQFDDWIRQRASIQTEQFRGDRNHGGGDEGVGYIHLSGKIEEGGTNWAGAARGAQDKRDTRLIFRTDDNKIVWYDDASQQVYEVPKDDARLEITRPEPTPKQARDPHEITVTVDGADYTVTFDEPLATISNQAFQDNLDEYGTPGVAKAEFRKLRAQAQAGGASESAATGARRDPTQVSMFNPYNDGDIVTIDGQDWTVKQDTPGWYLTNTGNWRGTHPTIRNIKAMADLIREVEQASVAQKAAEIEPEAHKLTPAEAKSLMAWEDLGQKDGVKTHALTFYESQADKDAKRGRMIVAKVSKGDRSATAWMVDGEDKTFGMLAQAKKLAEEVGMAKAVADGFVEPAAAPASLQEGIAQAQANAARFEIGKSLTKEQRKQVLATLTDVYKTKRAERELKGVGRDGNERYGYVHSPELFEKSDITGAMVRYYVTLPDGKIAHPTELFPDYTQSDIDSELERRATQAKNMRDTVRRQYAPEAQQFNSVVEAGRFWDEKSDESLRKHGQWRTILPSLERTTLSNGEKFIMVPDATMNDQAMVEAFADEGWTPWKASAAEPTKPAAPIEDAGEKIGGARKDRWKERGLNLDDLDAMTEAEGAELATKANVWKPDYEALAAQSEPVTAAMVKTIYDQLAAKPKQNTPEGRRQYVQMMRIVRDVLTEAKGPEAVKNAYLEIRKRAGLNAADPAAKATGRELLFSVYKGRSDPFVLGYTEMSKAKKLVEDGFPAKGEPWKTRLSVGRAEGGPGTTERGIEIYVERSAEVGTPLTREQILGGFYRVTTKDNKTVAFAPTKADAEAAAATVYERDMKGKKDGKPEPVRPNLDELKRENLPQRIDRDVTSEDFVRDLGFRGVEFGNWSAQDERQRILNMAYDGLMDLAEIMGVPPKAMSLNGTLGMAFGARGGGRFAAHYEPGKLVINMTKIRGGGSMAHEWAHAMDHYFGELDKSDAYTTQARGASGWYSEDQYNGVPRKRMERVGNEWKNVEKMRLDNLRPEMAAAFDEVMRALFQKQITKAEMVRSHELDLERTQALARSEQDAEMKAMYQNMVQNKREALNELRNDPEGKLYAGRGRSDYAQQAQALSGKSVDGYWVRPTEMFARAFESWVFDKVTAMGARSDYLVHGVEEDRFAGGGYKGNPYPTGEERARINAAFDKLASTIKTKQTDKGVAMFSRATATQAAIGTPAATIRAAITKAYGKLLGQLESKGLVTLTQTQDEAIEAAARARADKTGQPLAEVRASLMGSVSNSVATDTPAFKRWFGDSKAVDADGKPLVVYHGTGRDIAEFDTGNDDRLQVNGNRTGAWGAYFSPSAKEASIYAEMSGGDQAVMPVYLSLQNPYVMSRAEWGKHSRTSAKMETRQEGRGYAKQVKDDLIAGGYDGIVIRDRGFNDEWVAFRPEQVKSAIGNNGDFDPNDLDIRRSANGAIQGFFDPQTGQSFLIADNLTAEAAPGVLMHEVGIHMAADGSMKALFNRAAMMLKLQRGNPFMKAVQARMDAAGETSGEEAAAYIAEAYENDRANAPASVQRWLADLLAAVKAWMFKKGIMGAGRLTVADIAAVARANAKTLARGQQGIRAALAFSKAFQPVWYSALQNSIGSLNMKAAPATGWASTIDGLVKAGKVKADEVEWSGVKEWLQLQTGKVTREQVMEYLDANGVKVEEVTLGERAPWRQRMDLLDNTRPLTDEQRDELTELHDRFDREGRDPTPEREQTKFGQYTLPGGENYREVLLTLPRKASENFVAVDSYGYIQERFDNKTAAEEYVNQRDGLHVERDETINPPDLHAYRSSHWDQPNVLAHIRLNDRTDADGKRVLFVEEIQSDWGQEGKKKGFGEKTPKWEVFNAKTGEVVSRHEREDDATKAAIYPLEDGMHLDWRLAPERSAVPLAPFVDKTDKWLTLALKRIITMAAQEGYDRVAFVNGEQSAERYDLSKEVSALKWETKAMTGHGGRGTLTAIGRHNQEIMRKEMEPSEIEDHIGKEVASRLLDAQLVAEGEGRKAAGVRRLSGIDLKVGGEGMKSFYDTIVPNTLKALLKKVGGGQLETTGIVLDDRTNTRGGWHITPPDQTVSGKWMLKSSDYNSKGLLFDTEAEARAALAEKQPTSQQPSFTITPAMREKVAGGLPLFSRQVQGENQTDTPAFRKWFGDSKVVDADGKPLVVYHETISGGTIPEDGIATFNTPTFFSSSPKTYFFVFQVRPDGFQKYPVYVALKNPKITTDANLASTPGLKDAEAFKGYDGVILKDDGGSIVNVIAFRPEQIKSATGNRGTFDPNNADIRFSRAADLRKEAAGQVVDLFHTATNVPGRMNWWHKTVGTMYNLAQRSPEFKRVFSAVQDFIDDTAYYADRAARLAPNILPKLETWRDVFKSPMSAVDNRAIRAPIFEGTLTWMRDESGKPVKAEDVRLAAEDLTTDQKAQRLLRNDFVTDSTLRMWRGLPLEQYESIIEGSYERHMLRAGIVFTPDELKSLFKLTDGQVKLYQEFRRATDMSLTNLAISEMVKLGGQDTASMRQAALESEDVVKASAMLRDHLLELADSDAEKSKGYIDAANKIIALSDKAKNLMDKGYAPLSRFGHYTVDVVGPDGTREYFGMFESRFEAAKMAEAKAKNYPDARIERGTVSEQAYKLFAGVTPETIELFGEILGLDTQGDGTQNQAFKAFVQRATANRSAMKRLLERKGIAGFSEDAGRVLAGFVFSNGRRTASNLHGLEMKEAAEAIPKQQGELKDHAVALVEYVQNPQEEAQGLRGLLFTQYIGGSIASAIVNMTQPLTMSLPYLSQFGGITQAGRQMARAVKDVGKTTTGDKALDAAMTAAEEKGIVSPQEVHQLQQQAAGRAALQVGDGTMAGDARAKAGNALSKTMLAWGKLFSAAEQFNRRVTFIAAYRTAVDRGIENPAKFAEDAVIETQGLYNKGNKPKWARGAIGSTLFTFKQYSVAYVEMLGRLAQSGPEGRRAALYALAILFMLSGAGGMPGADDLDDLISGLMQKLGYNFNSKSARRAFFAKHLGQAGSDFVERGVSGLAGVPIDISGRMGLGNLIPGTGLLTKKTDHTSDVAELAGPAGDLAKRAFQAGSKAMDGDLIGKDGAVTTLAPLAVRNLSQAADMAKHGMYRDARGRKVVETDQLDALSKAFGFQPNDVKRVQDATREVQQMISLNKIRETEIADQWAKAMFERDKDGVQEARDALKRWNADNPESPIRISMQQINKRLANMRMSKEDRMAKTASKEIRATVRRELEAAR